MGPFKQRYQEPTAAASQGGAPGDMGCLGTGASGALHRPGSAASHQHECTTLLCPIHRDQFLSLSLLFFLYHSASLTDNHLAPTLSCIQTP